MLRLICLLLALAAALPARAQPTFQNVTLRVDTRYDNIDGGNATDRLQGALRLGLDADLGSGTALVALLATGNDFTSRWSTLRNNLGGGSADPMSVRFRQVFGQVTRERYRVQAGAIPPVKGVVSPTGLEPVGWIDGARVEWYNAPGGVIELVVGRLASLDQPNAFARPSPFLRPSRLNYVELEISQQPWEHVSVEASAEYIVDPYVRGEVRWQPSSSFEAFAETLLNLDKQSIKTGLTAIFTAPSDQVELLVNHAYKAAEIGLRGELAEDFFTFGHSLTVSPSGVISTRWGLRWAAEVIFAERPSSADPESEAITGDGLYVRFNAGVRWRVR